MRAGAKREGGRCQVGEVQRKYNLVMASEKGELILEDITFKLAHRSS